MNPALRRGIWLSLIALAVAFVCYQQTIPAREDYGIDYVVARNAPGQVRVVAVHPGSPAAAAGIRAGDNISYGSTAADRANVVYATGGTRVTVIVNGTRTVHMTARSLPPDRSWPGFAIRLAFLLVAGLLAWRRPDDRAARVLVVFLWCFGLAIAMSNGLLPVPLLSLIVLQIGTVALFFIGIAAAATFAAIFPSGTAQAAPRALAFVARAISAALLIALFPSEFLLTSADAISLLNLFFIAAFTVDLCIVVATLVAAYVQGQPWERQRRRWVFLILGVGLSGPLIDTAVTAVGGLNHWVDMFSLVPTGLIPIGLAYVILRHRVIDVGFVLNRALVYTGVSAIVVAVFVVVESLLSRYVEDRNHVGSIAVQLAVALILGFSIRFIHARVDRFVDAVLFRERHAAEAAMREFAHDASYVTDARVLLARCVEVVERCAGACGAGVWIAEADRTYVPAESTFEASPPVSENDPAVLAMRARRVVADLRATASAMPGVIAFPMVVRGDLIGMLVCGPKSGDETYAPDERASLEALASGVGHALDAIEVRDLRRRLALLEGDRALDLGATGGGLGTF